MERQALRLDPKGKGLKDEEKLASLGLAKNAQLYFRDLGPQIAWKTVGYLLIHFIIFCFGYSYCLSVIYVSSTAPPFCDPTAKSCPKLLE